MGLSYKILSVFGIDIELHLLFIFFILFALISSPMLGLLLILLFFYVTLHELVHSVVAMRHDIKVKRIILLPFGGMAMIDTTNLKPKTEIKMAIAGPLFNIAVAGICLFIAYLANIDLFVWVNQLFSGTLTLTLLEWILFYSFFANAMLAAFNLLVPAFPLDGGRVLRAVLALKFDYIKATKIARNVGIILALMLIIVPYIIWGIIDLWITIIALFIMFGAMGEYQATVIHVTLSKINIKDVISKEYVKVPATASLEKVVEKMIKEKLLNVIVPGKKPRVLSLQQISMIPHTEWKKLTAEKVARYVGHAGLSSSSEKIMRRMMQTNVSMLPVIDKGRLIGVVNGSDIKKMMRITETIGRKL